jgi:hypothetical protein
MSSKRWVEAALRGMLTSTLASTAFAVGDARALVGALNAAGVHWGAGVFMLSHGDGRLTFWGAGDDMAVFPVQRARGGLRLLNVTDPDPRSWEEELGEDPIEAQDPVREDDEPSNRLQVFEIFLKHLQPRQYVALYGRQHQGTSLILSKWELGERVCRGHRFEAFGEVALGHPGAVDTMAGTQGTLARCITSFNDMMPAVDVTDRRVLQGDFAGRRNSAGAA